MDKKNVLLVNDTHHRTYLSEINRGITRIGDLCVPYEIMCISKTRTNYTSSRYNSVSRQGKTDKDTGVRKIIFKNKIRPRMLTKEPKVHQRPGI